MTRHFADRLVEAVKSKASPACVGFDPVYDRLPPDLRKSDASLREQAAAILTYGKRLLDVVAPLVSVVKINIAFFEAFRGAGIDAYFELIAAARAAGLIVIGDIKRGDVGHSSAAYAAAQLADGDGPAPDAVTISSYFGIDGVQPFLDIANRQNKGVFALVHTSNPSAGQVQHLHLDNGAEVADSIGRLVNDWAHAEGMIGLCGRSCVGAVVAPGDVDRARRLRQVMPDSTFLVPGFGAQGRGVEQVAACFNADGSGAIVNASRSVIFAYEDERLMEQAGGRWEDAVALACKEFIGALRSING